MEKWRFRYFGDPILRTRCKPIDKVTDEIRELAKYMIWYIDTHNGIGMAAPQMGVSIRMFVLRDYIVLPDKSWTHSDPKVFINPQIIWKSDEVEEDEEGCLSIPRFYLGPIERPKKVKVEALNLDELPFMEEKEGLNARVIFHENDHLNGVLHVDRLPKNVRSKIEPQLQLLKKRHSN